MNYLLPTNLCDKSILSVDVKQGDPILSRDLKLRVKPKDMYFMYLLMEHILVSL